MSYPAIPVSFADVREMNGHFPAVAIVDNLEAAVAIYAELVADPELPDLVRYHTSRYLGSTHRSIDRRARGDVQMTEYSIVSLAPNVPFRIKHYICTCIWEKTGSRTRDEPHGMRGSIVCRRVEAAPHAQGGICGSSFADDSFVYLNDNIRVVVDDLAVALEQAFT